MRLIWRYWAAIAGLVVGSCTTTPGMPPDFALPVQAILRHTVCELRVALLNIEQTNPSFSADQWAIQITLTPKADTELSVRAGLTGKSTKVTKDFFNTWAVGTAPGAEIDTKGHTDGSVAYTLHSKQLMDQKKYPLDCDPSTPSYHALAGKLGINDWLMRTASAREGDIAALTHLDKPTYNSQIVIKTDGAGNFTYNFPFGTDFGGLYASYALDESLSILFTPEPKKPKPVRTLPTGAGFVSVGGGTQSNISPGAQNRLDMLQLEQTLRNLQVQQPRTR